jgi:hypothetical protein
MKKVLYVISFLFLFVVNTLFASKETPVLSVVGTALVAGDVSPNMARAQALSDAKINALKKAGVGEQISSHQLLFTSEHNNDYSQFFSSDIQSEIQGTVKSYEIQSERLYCKNELEIVCEIIIDAIIIEYDSEADAKFNANIEGLKAIYSNDDTLSFSVKTTLSCYLTIFNITDSEALMMYPNNYEKPFSFKPLISYHFPTRKINYTLHTDLKESETNRLIFVFTKTPINFIKMNKDQVITKAEDIFSWIYSISPDQRKVQYLTLSIQK